MVTLIEYYKTFLIYTMKKIFLLLIVFFTCFQVSAEDRKTIRVSTDNTDLILKVAPNGRLYQFSNPQLSPWTSLLRLHVLSLLNLQII